MRTAPGGVDAIKDAYSKAMTPSETMSTGCSNIGRTKPVVCAVIVSDSTQYNIVATEYEVIINAREKH